MSEGDRPTVAVFRPDDGRLAEAVDRLARLDVDPLPDPMLAVAPTGATPRTDADVAILTSTTGVALVAEADWAPGEARLCAIGETTAEALRSAGYEVDVVPREYSSSGLVTALEDRVEGRRVEVARSDHGSDVLLEGLGAAGAYVHETILYRLRRPADSGQSVVAAADGQLDGALFTSSLTVEHFLDAAAERDLAAAARDGLAAATVGAIGEPTRETAEAAGIPVDVVPETADFDALARAVAATLGRG